jgi:arylsulfatase A-like enzyme
MISRRSLLLAAAAAPRPNILLILADDLGWADLGCYGARDIRTPHIDALAQQGVRYTQFYANAPECTPSRTALLTGRYPHRVGGLECAIGVGNVGRYDEAVWLQERGELGLPATEATLGQMLRGAGYQTACIGKWHLGYAPKFSALRHGFEHYFGVIGGNADYFTHFEEGGAPAIYEGEKQVDRPGYVTDLIGEEALRWLGERTAAKPFFLYVPFTAPHTPIQGPGREAGRPGYAAMVERMDHYVGKLVAAVPAETIVIFASDNGAMGVGSNGPLRGTKTTTFEGGIRVPCILRYPGKVKPGTESARVAMHMDLTATLLAAARVKPARRLDGEDLLGPAKERAVFWRYKRMENRRKAVRRGNWKLVVDNGREYLFHLGEDREEKQDRLQQAPAEAAALRRLLAAWEEEVKAPRLAGFRGTVFG